MPTHAELAAKLLRDAATFFTNLGNTNESLHDQMTENATVFTQVATLIEQDPSGALDGTPHGQLSRRLLVDAAGFFRALAEENAAIKEQMQENATVYEQLGELVQNDPHGVLD